MSRPKILRLWGKADNLEIEFKEEGGMWKVDIPPDLKDGVYVVQLYAINELFETSFWIGELYMCNGTCCFTIQQKPYQMWFNTKSYSFSFYDNYLISIEKKKLADCFCDWNFQSNINIVNNTNRLILSKKHHPMYKLDFKVKHLEIFDKKDYNKIEEDLYLMTFNVFKNIFKIEKGCKCGRN